MGTPDSRSPIEAERFIARLVAAARETDPAAADRLAEAFHVAANDGLSLDAAVGLPAGWRIVRARTERARLITELRIEHYATLSDHAASEAIAADARRYIATSWPRDRETAAMPARYAGTPRETFWQALHLAADFPSSRQVRRILAGEPEDGS